MANENWEEISEWDIEEDIDLAQRITVHSVHSIDDEEEFQFIQAHKNPTYAAAAKWGDRKPSTNDDKTNITKGDNKKKSSSTSPKGVKDDKEKKSSSASPKDTKDTKDDKEKKPSSSEDVKNDNIENEILKGDHDVDYETPVSSKDRKETRRNNNKLHKIHSQKLMTSLISDAELESNQDLVKGDTNRDPEFKKYKLLKKTLALNKKYAEKSKSNSNRKNLERVEVW